MVQLGHHDYRLREHQNYSALKDLSILCPSPLDPLLIPPSTKSSLVPAIYTTSDEEFISFYEELKRQSYQNPERNMPMQKLERKTKKMEPKKTKSTTSKEKELEIIVTPLVQRLQNISKAKVQ